MNMMNTKKSLFFLMMVILGAGCTSSIDPPYNNFEHQKASKHDAAVNTTAATAAGFGLGALVSLGTGTAAGGLLGATMAISEARKEPPQQIIQKLENEDIQVVQEGRRMTLIIPTDKYYLTESYILNDLEYKGLNNLVALALNESHGMIRVAGFADDGISGLSDRQKLSEERAKSMADFLWANGIPLNRLTVIGYGKRYDIADNQLIHGAAMNRRVEIQWETQFCPPSSDLFCQD